MGGKGPIGRHVFSTADPGDFRTVPLGIFRGADRPGRVRGGGATHKGLQRDLVGSV